MSNNVMSEQKEYVIPFGELTKAITLAILANGIAENLREKAFMRADNLHCAISARVPTIAHDKESMSKMLEGWKRLAFTAEMGVEAMVKAMRAIQGEDDAAL